MYYDKNSPKVEDLFSDDEDVYWFFLYLICLVYHQKYSLNYLEILIILILNSQNLKLK